MLKHNTPEASKMLFVIYSKEKFLASSCGSYGC